MKSHLIPLGWAALILCIIAVVGGLLTPTSMSAIFSLLFAFFVYFILPGYSVLLFLPLDGLERALLAMPTSASIVPVLLYFANLLGLPLSRMVVVSIILLVTLAAWLGVASKQRGGQQSP